MEIQVSVEELRKNKLFVATPMYGGQCYGLYVKSCLDLQNQMNKYGVETKFSFLFNESLITRARNYLVDEFLRTDFTHLLFIDSDIHYQPQDVIAMLALNKDVIGAPYPKKSQPANAIIETEDGFKTIKWIVDNKYSGKVLCLNNETFLPEWKNVISYSIDKGHSSKKWVKIGNFGRKMLIATEDHECAVVDNILIPEKIEYIRADQLENRYIIKKITDNNKLSDNPLYGKDQMSFLIGTMIGDGSIVKGYLKFGHSLSQEDYLNLKQQIFGGKISKIRKVGNYKNKDYFAKFLECRRNAQILELESLMYINGKKTIENVIDMLDEKGLAFWYMDDGSLRNKNTKGFITLHTNGFSVDDVNLIINHLKNKWDIDASITIKDNIYPIIDINTNNSDKFFQLIAPYIIETMEYKLPKRFHEVEKYNYTECKFLGFSAEKVKQVKYIDNCNKNSHFQPRKQYDIGIEGNYNFFSNGYLVHNSINWNNVKQSILDHPDIDPKELENLVGEYVFNVVKGTSKFNVTEPLEVMEIGTGYMLIKRNVFDKMRESYPQIHYKPDHVGQANFDGSRYIHAYFDTSIDSKGSIVGGGSDRYLSEDYQFCLPRRSLISTEDGLKSIGEIVDNQYKGRVYSLDNNGKLTLNNIIGYSKRNNNGKKWVKLKTTSDNNRKLILKCTDDHRVFYFDSLLQPLDIKYGEAKNLSGKYLIRFSDNDRDCKENTLFNDTQFSALIGTFLGDSSISKKGQLKISHSDSQKEYLRCKSILFNSSEIHTKNMKSGFGNGKNTNSIYIGINEQTRYLRNIGYCDIKTVKNIIPLINEISLAYWYMDDGSFNDQNSIRLHTEGFSYEDNLLLQNMFKDKWNITPVITERFIKYKGENRKYYLSFNKEDTRIFFDLIKSYIYECMEYKLPEEYRGIDKKELSNKRLDFAASFVKKVEITNLYSKLYDIEVENDHNFFANGTLVHNCQLWRKIGGQVWLCPWIRSQHIGTYAFTGNMPSVAQFSGKL